MGKRQFSKNYTWENEKINNSFSVCGIFLKVPKSFTFKPLMQFTNIEYFYEA